MDSSSGRASTTPAPSSRTCSTQREQTQGNLAGARYYEFKSLYSLEEYGLAYALLKSDEPAPWLISTKNAAWMFSVGAELAWRERDFEAIAEWGKKSLESRVEVGDLVEVVGCLQTVCNLLGKAGRPDSNGFLREPAAGSWGGAWRGACDPGWSRLPLRQTTS